MDAPNADSFDSRFIFRLRGAYPIIIGTEVHYTLDRIPSKQRSLAVYEQKHQAPISRKSFVRRLLVHLTAALGLLALSLAIGMLGYVLLEDLSWIDAFLDAAMLLGGMGPVNPPQTTPGKLFAGIYALYAGLVFIVTTALLFAPIFHRLIHSFHWSEKV